MYMTVICIIRTHGVTESSYHYTRDRSHMIYVRILGWMFSLQDFFLLFCELCDGEKERGMQKKKKKMQPLTLHVELK